MAAARAAGDPGLPAVADAAGVPGAAGPEEVFDAEPPPPPELELEEPLGDPTDGVFTDGVRTLGAEGVLTLGTDGVLTCGTGVLTLGTEGVLTWGTDGVLTWGTAGTGTDAFGVWGSWTVLWSWRTDTALSELESTPCAELAMGTTAAMATVTATAARLLLSLDPVTRTPQP